MKWKDLSLKERKQIYDSVRVNNPDATYFDIKEQFDSIPTYEDGKNSESDQAWKINETVRLGMEGKPVPQDSLQHIIDRARMQNKPRSYDSTVGAIEQGKQVLSGLNKTVGTAATGASLLTMGGWNLLRTLGLGKGTPYRLWASKNALTGAKAGLAADAAQFVEDPNIDNGLQTAISLFPLGPKGYIDPKTQITGLLESVGDVKDLVPAYEDGKGKTINKEDLPPEYRTGTPEYFERQRRISGAATPIQPEAYITPAGYIKDAVNFIEDLGKGDYTGAAMDAVLNLIPWGVGKGIKKLKSKVGRIIEGTEMDGATVHSFSPTQTKKKTRKKTEEDYDSEFSEVLRKDRNSKKYQQEISRTIEQAIFPDERTRELVENVDKTYGTNYKRAYSNIAYKDMTKRGSYVKWGDTDKDGYGQINIKNIKDNVLPTDINDYNVILDNNIYMPGTANHELGHVADGLAGSRKIQDFDSGKEYITNTYLNYLANPNNAYSSAELRKMGLFDAAGSRSYLLNPTEAKSHMLTLKRSLKDSGKITNWSTPVDEKMILEYMRNPTSNKMVKNQYDLYRNKNEYIDRLNKLIPMEILMPLGGAGFVGHELNKE